MKILLVSSRTKFGKYGSTLPPLGLASVASRLVKEGFEVRILDQPTERTTKEGFEEYLLREKPDVITFGAFTMEMPEVAEEARAAKRVLPNVKTVIGGYHVISLPTETLDEFKEFDFGAAGEGQCLVNLANALRSNLDFADFKGIVYRENGKAVYTGAPPKIMDLDGIPFPTYDLLPMKKYRYQQERTKDRQYFTMMTMRGCPFQCTFCANAGSFAGMRSVKNVLEEIDVLYNKYGVRAIGFLDDTFNITKERVMELCEGLIKRNYDLVWGCLCRVAPVDDEMLGAMKKAGCAKISYGVESGNQEILNLMKKGITLEQIRNTFALTRKNGIITLAYAMINHPDETRENINETKKFVKSLKPDY
ncbi:MAG: radical SAM protein, partial [archaeon]